MGKDWQKHAENTLVANLPHGVQIILAHPGQELNRDPTYLHQNFGITPSMVTTMSDSEHKPLTEQEKIEAHADRLLQEDLAAADRQDRLEAALRERRESRVVRTVTKPPPVTTEKPGPETTGAPAPATPGTTGRPGPSTTGR